MGSTYNFGLVTNPDLKTDKLTALEFSSELNKFFATSGERSIRAWLFDTLFVDDCRVSTTKNKKVFNGIFDDILDYYYVGEGDVDDIDEYMVFIKEKFRELKNYFKVNSFQSKLNDALNQMRDYFEYAYSDSSENIELSAEEIRSQDESFKYYFDLLTEDFLVYLYRYLANELEFFKGILFADGEIVSAANFSLIKNAFENLNVIFSYVYKEMQGSDKISFISFRSQLAVNIKSECDKLMSGRNAFFDKLDDKNDIRFYDAVVEFYKSLISVFSNLEYASFVNADVQFNFNNLNVASYFLNDTYESAILRDHGDVVVLSDIEVSYVLSAVSSAYDEGNVIDINQIADNLNDKFHAGIEYIRSSDISSDLINNGVDDLDTNNNPNLLDVRDMFLSGNLSGVPYGLVDVMSNFDRLMDGSPLKFSVDFALNIDDMRHINVKVFVSDLANYLYIDFLISYFVRSSDLDFGTKDKYESILEDLSGLKDFVKAYTSKIEDYHEKNGLLDVIMLYGVLFDYFLEKGVLTVKDDLSHWIANWIRVSINDFYPYYLSNSQSKMTAMLSKPKVFSDAFSDRLEELLEQQKSSVVLYDFLYAEFSKVILHKRDLTVGLKKRIDSIARLLNDEYFYGYTVA